jgi:hypothetical protein
MLQMGIQEVALDACTNFEYLPLKIGQGQSIILEDSVKLLEFQ